MTTVLQQLALDFNVGGNRPDTAKLGITGKLALDKQLHKGENFVIQILDEDNEIIAAGSGTCVAVAFTDKTDKEGDITTTREHKIKLD